MYKDTGKERSMQRFVFVFLTSFLLITGSRQCYGAGELYLAGTPDAKPLEFYDNTSDIYLGVLPDLIQEICSKEDITVRYIEPSRTDSRLKLAENVQVDAVCTIGLTDDELEQAGLSKGSEIFTYEEKDEIVRVSLAYTKSVPVQVREALEKGLGNLEASRIQGLLLQYAMENSAEDDYSFIYKQILPLLLGIAVIFLIILPVYLLKQRRLMEEKAYRDEITGWENFYGWKRRFKKCIVDGNRQHYAVLYMYAGLDQVSHVYGYPEAENALCLITEILREQIDRECESFSRFNEYFFTFFVQYTGTEELRSRVEQIHERILQGFRDRSKKYFLDLHTGIYRLTDIDHEPVKALQFSDVAMEFARMNYLSCAFYNEFVEQETIAGYTMEHEAIHGLMHQEFVMYLQPMIDLRTGSICGAEALVRWNNPNRGLLRPDEFLAIMKKKQLTGKMNMDIYKQGCSFLSRELERGNAMRLLFNFTVENIRESRFPEQLYAVAQQYGIATEQIMIQLNQLIDISSAEGSVDTVKKLVNYGFDLCLAGLELDRVFLQYLQCGVRIVKIRKELVQNLHTPEGKTIVDSLVSLCHELGMQILVMGVETELQARQIEQIGCEFASGYYYHYPVSQQNFPDLIVNKAEQTEIEEN